MNSWKSIGIYNEGDPSSAGALSAISFDPFYELLWTGFENGQIKSSYGPLFCPYVRSVAHSSRVGQVLPNERGVYSISGNSLRLNNRKGTPKWEFKDPDAVDFQSMIFQNRTSPEIVIGGYQQKIMAINADRGTVTHKNKYPSDVFIMRRNRLLCCGSGNGEVVLYDPSSFQPITKLVAHTGALSDLDTSGNLLLTCGYSVRHGSYIIDPFVKVWDLRNLSSLVPVPFPSGPSLVRMHPKLSTTAIICSATGQFHIVDTGNSIDAKLQQVTLNSYLTNMDVSSSGDAIAFTDMENNVHLWAMQDSPSFSEFKLPVPWEENTHEVNLEMNDDTPLNSIGMPFYKEELLSAWSGYSVVDAGKPDISSNDLFAAQLSNKAVPSSQDMKVTRRNQTVEVPWLGRCPPQNTATPRFRSERQKDIIKGSDHPDNVSFFEELEDSESGPTTIPLFYKKPEIRYSKFGIEDFDFAFYNKTRFAGLETDIANSYCNPVLQLYNYIPVFQRAAILHSMGSCPLMNCLLCELGFLFAMLKDSNGQNCQATNFLRTFSASSLARTVGIVFDEENEVNIQTSAVIQACNRFLLTEVSRCLEYEIKSVNSRGPLSQLVNSFAVIEIRTYRCSICGVTSEKEQTSYPVLDLQYPSHQLETVVSFEWLLKLSFDQRIDLSPRWCNHCKSHQPFLMRSTVKEPPPVFFIHTNIQSEKQWNLWARKDWLPTELYFYTINDSLQCVPRKQVNILGLPKSKLMLYRLRGAVHEIRDDTSSRSHFVSVIRVSDNLARNDNDDCYIFNDFLVKKISTEEALTVHGQWKVPAVLCFERVNFEMPEMHEEPDSSILHKPYSVNEPSPELNKTVPLKEDEHLGPNSIVGIDSEFVALQPEETEVRSDGSKATVKPSKLSLARVSVVRGDGPLKGVAFIDDYVATEEHIADYLTEFSGIHPGDLDPKTSRHSLVPLKIAYKKLRMLVNAGCKFVGHGLQKDFRIINILVPPSQVIDTVDLFFIASRQRKLSLKFLAWYLLDEDIQLEEHDSIEDALSALKLYDCYNNLRSSLTFEKTLEEIYDVGRLHKYRPPSSVSAMEKSIEIEEP